MHGRLIETDSGQAMTLTHYARRTTLALSAGESDDVFFQIKRRQLIVLSLNQRLGYLGLEVFDLSDMYDFGSQNEWDSCEDTGIALSLPLIHEFFSQSDDELREILGPGPSSQGPLDYSSSTLVRRVLNHLDACVA